MNLKLLSEPFPEQDIEWRVQDCGEKNGKIWARVLAYVTNRAIMERLDDVVGIESWKNEYLPGPSGGVVCGISIKIGDEWVTKWDGAENSNIEGVKGGLSNSMKRAAVQWGIGRYLYKLEAGFAEISEAGRMSGKLKSGNWFRWDPPFLPEWALPETPRMKEVREALEAMLKKKLFEHPENVEKVIADKNLAGMEKALAVAKEKEAQNG